MGMLDTKPNEVSVAALERLRKDRLSKLRDLQNEQGDLAQTARLIHEADLIEEELLQCPEHQTLGESGLDREDDVRGPDPWIAVSF